MKRITLPLATAMMLLSGCKFYQVYHAAPSGTGITQEDGHHVYNNGTVRVIYDFWARQGTMSFVIYNTSQKPIYIDWKRSSFVQDNQKKNYYIDATTSKYESLGLSDSRGRRGAQASITRGVDVKEERITFLPPGSFIEKRFYKLIPGSIAVQYSMVRDTMIGKKEAMVAHIDKSNGTLVFRNFITYSTTEDFKEEMYVDNEFYVDRVVFAHDGVVRRDDNGNYHYPGEGPQTFYLNNLSKKEVVR